MKINKQYLSIVLILIGNYKNKITRINCVFLVFMSSHYMKLFTLVKKFFKKSCFCIILPYNFLFKTAPLCLFLFIFLSCIDKIKLLASIRKKLALGEHRSPIWKTIIDSTQTFLTYIIITLIMYVNIWK